MTGIEPYLGADGHLVALREDDLAFLHVHPGDPDGRAGVIGFAAALPSPGGYRLFLQFTHDGRVGTVAHTVAVPALTSPTGPPPPRSGSGRLRGSETPEGGA